MLPSVLAGRFRSFFSFSCERAMFREDAIAESRQEPRKSHRLTKELLQVGKKDSTRREHVSKAMNRESKLRAKGIRKRCGNFQTHLVQS